jgi:hypothetical protein
VLYKPTDDGQQDLRYYCRNPRCGSKLKLPACSPRDAFCCRCCYTNFYRTRCLVCERLITRKTERQRICDSGKCRNEFRRHRERFSSARYPISTGAPKAPRSALKSGVKTGLKSDRAWRIIAGPSRLTPPSTRSRDRRTDGERNAFVRRHPLERQAMVFPTNARVKTRMFGVLVYAGQERPRR